MKRRAFFGLAGALGLTLGLPIAFRGSTRARAAGDEPYAGPFFVFVTASGAWDPRFMFDPSEDPDQNRLTTEIGNVGRISFSPTVVDPEALGYGPETAPYLMSNEAFLAAHGARLTVINGIDTGTNNHDVGVRLTTSGSTTRGFPSLGALVAADRAPRKPMAYVSGGGYDATAGLVPLTRANDVGALRRVARPHLLNPDEPDSERYHTRETVERIERFSAERLEALRGAQRLPRLQRAMDEFTAAKAQDDTLARLALPDELVDVPLRDLENFMRQAQLAIAAFEAGLAVSANLELGGFDTHADHDRDQVRQIAKLLAGLDFLLRRSSDAGLGGDLYVIVASDFGRGPYYNGNDGKDHWPVTSMLVSGPGLGGDRVLGGTTEDQQPKGIDRSSLEAVDSGGVTLTPAVVHRSLRTVSGITGNELDESFPLPEDDLQLFA